MAISDTIQSIETNLENAYDIAQQKGATIPANKNLANLSNTINTIPNDGSGPYVRPSDWLNIPTMDGTQDEVYILLGVGDNCLNKCFLVISDCINGYIDWGDGTIDSIDTSSVLTYSHEYDPSLISIDTWTTHNQCKQVLIHVYAQRNSISSFTFSPPYYQTVNGNQVAINALYSCDIFQISGNVNSCLTTLRKSSSPYGLEIQFLEIFEWVGYIQIQNGSFKFNSASYLQKISDLSFDNLDGNVTGLFGGCSRLKNIGTLTFTNNITNTSHMFAYTKISEMPILNTAHVTDMRNMFGSCSNLTTVNYLNTDSATNIDNLFYSCDKLKNIPLLNTNNVTSAKYVFYGCSSLEEIPYLNLENVTSANNYIMNIRSAEKTKEINLKNVTQMNGTFLSSGSYLLNGNSKLKILGPINFNNLERYSTGSLTILHFERSPVEKCFPFNFTKFSTRTDYDTVLEGDLSYFTCPIILYGLGSVANANNTLHLIDLENTIQSNQWWLDLFNSLATNNTGYNLGVHVGNNIRNSLTNVYVKATTDHEVYTLPTNDTTFDSSKTYYTYDDSIEDFVQFTGNDFVAGQLYYEDVTNAETKYVLCESTDVGAVLMLDWLTNTKGWTIS